jgi:hypothetical protein
VIHFDQNIWLRDSISNKSNTAWRCSYCGTGSLQLLEKLESKRSFHRIWLKCTNPECKKQFHAVGKVKSLGDGDEVGSKYFRIDDYKLYPAHFQPEVILFELPITLGDDIKTKLIKSFNHFWYDLDACANKIRQAIELIIEEKNGIGSNLDQKIASLRTSLGESLANTILALKWIGNEGSHIGRPFTREEILNAFGLLVDVLNKLYPDELENIRRESLVQLILENKGLKKV